MSITPKIIFREGTEKDSNLIFNKIKDLARFLDNEHMVTLSEKDFAKECKSENKFINLLIAETDEEDSKFVGFSLYFPVFNSYHGKRLFMEDLFIDEQYRGHGFGKSFLQELSKIGVQNGCGGMEWVNHPKNNRAVKFYTSLGAVNLTETEQWQSYYFPKDVFMKLANAN
ncbi:thialysine N-epsilon-acetyltransferase-like [Antedon mediterranea]|uniref:thialysine N-epsilon-acetyltransferase-like n=1 Tax=Antedon mediterranea TaxID=105859 RepID=UPI003AF49EC7